MNTVNQLMQQDPLVSLIQKDNFVGWVYALDYDTARVMTNDLWKAQVQGVPLNCFLIAATFDPETFSQIPEADREVLLMRVVGFASLPQDNDMVRTKIGHSNALKSSTGTVTGTSILRQAQRKLCDCAVTSKGTSGG